MVNKEQVSTINKEHRDRAWMSLGLSQGNEWKAEAT